MSNPTTPFSWQMPTSTDLVTDLPADFEVFGQAVATSMADLLGGTTGQILSKTSNTDMDFTWIANDQGDITGVTATSPLTGGGTSGAITVGIQDASTTQKGSVQLSDSTSTTSSILAATPTAVKSAYDLANAAIAKTTVTTAGDIIYRNATVPTRLGIGTAGQVLTVNTGATAPEWKTPTAATATFIGCRIQNSANQSIANNTDTALTFDSETFDTDGFHSTSSNTSRITIPAGKAGYYQFDAGVTWAAGSGIRDFNIYKNGSRAAYFTQNAQATNSMSQTITDVLYGAVGDYFELYVFQNNGSSINVQNFSSGGWTKFACAYVGA
jgi:hypothetical protein